MVAIRKVILGFVITRLVYDACWYVSSHNDHNLDEQMSKMKLEKENCKTFFNRPIHQRKALQTDHNQHVKEEFNNPVNFNSIEQACWCNFHEDGPMLLDFTETSVDDVLHQYDGQYEKKSLFKRVLDDMFYIFDLQKYIDAAIVLCVMIGLNREWLKNIVHVGLVILSLIYDPVIAIGVYGYLVLTPAPRLLLI